MQNFKMPETLQITDILDERIVLNVGGKRYETFKRSLTSIPDTRLAWVAQAAPHNTVPEYDSRKKEFFFDRHSTVFEEVLNYYRTGSLHCPRNVCSGVIEEEFSFWGIDETQMEACCWPEYNRQRASIKVLKDFNSDEKTTDSCDSSPSKEKRFKQFSKINLSRREENLRKTEQKVFVHHYEKKRQAVWRILEEPYSSTYAKVIAFVSMAFILISVINFSLATLPTMQQNRSIRFIERICGAWFTLEILLRLLFCPSVKILFQSPMTWVDVGALLPFYLNFVLNMHKLELGLLVVLRLLRVFRLFRYSGRLQVMALALKGSFHELCLLFLIMLISMFFFSTLIHYAEYRNGNSVKSFQNIPASFWWTVVTLTTVGYGDVTPETWLGKVIGGVCAIWGVLMIALPISIVNSNFSLYYSHGQALRRLPKKTSRNPLSPSIRRYLDYYDAISQLSINSRHKREQGLTGKGASFSEDPGNGSNAHDTRTYKRRCTGSKPTRSFTSRTLDGTVEIPLMPTDWAVNIELSDNEAGGLFQDNSLEGVGFSQSHAVMLRNKHDSYVL